MAITTSKQPPINFLFLFSTFLFGALLLVEGLGIHSEASQLKLQPKREHNFQSINIGDNGELRNMQHSRRLMIGSTMPTCTYNECRGCKYKCRAEQIPVDGNDPINSAYHYKCVCHR